jgi:MoaA/NifB/PqqE/SkfB family radical SAM enzyme
MGGLDRKLIAEYNATRGATDRSVLCHAPFTSVNFDQTGRANACCYNRAHVLGVYPRDNLKDMWFGAAAEELRRYIREDSLEGGCHMCRLQLDARNFAGFKGKFYDKYAPDPSRKANTFLKRLLGSRTVAMPKVMEFELENTCNLECIMCNGYFSSAIRKNREKRPPQASPYDRRFVEQLIDFMPHLEEMKFLGGEPFMIGIYYDIWEEVTRVNPAVKIHITTNATTLNPRTKKLLETMLSAGLDVSLCVSIDSVKKETYEKIRVGASFEAVMENIAWLLDYTRRKKSGARLSFAVCPMVVNRREMPDLVRFANERDVTVFFNTVINPPEQSLRYLAYEDLEALLLDYERRVPAQETEVEKINHAYFVGLVNQLKAWKEEIGKPSDAVRRFRSMDPGTRPQAPELTRKVLLACIVAAYGSRERLPADPDLAGLSFVNTAEFLAKKLEEASPETFLAAYVDCLDWVASECYSPAEYQDLRRKLDLLERAIAGLVTRQKELMARDLINGGMVAALSFMTMNDAATLEALARRYLV